MYRQPEYLTEAHHPKHRLRCPVHGFIRYSDVERKIIDHWLFRRLRLVQQLALTELIYPGACHTRFEHSLGVMEMATRMFDRLASVNGELMEKVFGEVDVLSEQPLAKARQICRLAALLHDTGHSCFSHAAESVFHKDSQHESLTVELIRSEEHLKPILDGEFFEGCAAITAKLIEADAKNPVPQIRLLRDIISGQIDADRSDYLIRDSHHCGVDYGRFDHLRLIECLTVNFDDATGELEMAISHDGIHSFESLILARHQMNTQVYYHRLRLIYDLYLKEFFKSLDPSEFDSSEKVLAWNDVRAMQRIIEASEDSMAKGHSWAQRIIHRRHHRNVFSIDEAEGVLALKKAKKVFELIQVEFSDVGFLADLRDKPVNIHKIIRDDDQDGGGIDFPMLENGKRSSLGGRSQILKSLPKSFRIGVIFADTQDREKKKEIGTRCRELYNQQ